MPMRAWARATSRSTAGLSKRAQVQQRVVRALHLGRAPPPPSPSAPPRTPRAPRAAAAPARPAGPPPPPAPRPGRPPSRRRRPPRPPAASARPRRACPSDRRRGSPPASSGRCGPGGRCAAPPSRGSTAGRSSPGGARTGSCGPRRRPRCRCSTLGPFRVAEARHLPVPLHQRQLAVVAERLDALARPAPSAAPRACRGSR